MTRSLAESLASLAELERKAVLASLTEAQAQELLWDWRFWARPDQIAPAGDWNNWLVLAGRGFGKTRCGAEWVREEVVAKRAGRIALVAETQKDLEEVMVFGASGIASVFPPHQRPVIVKKPIRIEFHTGAVAFGYNATEPDQLRGPQFDLAWSDELAKWRYAQETWDQLQFGLRIGTRPRQVITTTPRPIPLIKHLLADPQTIPTRGRTLDNAANLAPSFIKSIVDRYGGTRLGRQELDAEILDDVPGALWTRAMLDETKATQAPDLKRVVVAVDPSGTSGNDDGDSVGIVAAGLGVDGLAYVLADRTCSLSPDGWGKRVVATYSEFKADRVVGEKNFGGDMVRFVIQTADRKVSYRHVTASRGKIVRAEPIAALYEQGRVKHMGALPELEDQMVAFTSTGYVGEGSPDRADALVWALTELMLPRSEPQQPVFGSYGG